MSWSGITHQHLIPLMVRLPSDFEPYGARNRDEQYGPDCSCGRKWFASLEGKLSTDWGVCANPASPRVGLLTFEHQGCWQFEEDPESAARIERMRAANPNRFTRAELEARWRAKSGTEPPGAIPNAS